MVNIIYYDKTDRNEAYNINGEEELSRSIDIKSSNNNYLFLHHSDYVKNDDLYEFVMNCQIPMKIYYYTGDDYLRDEEKIKESFRGNNGDIEIILSLSRNTSDVTLLKDFIKNLSESKTPETCFDTFRQNYGPGVIREAISCYLGKVKSLCQNKIDDKKNSDEHKMLIYELNKDQCGSLLQEITLIQDDIKNG